MSVIEMNNNLYVMLEIVKKEANIESEISEVLLSQLVICRYVVTVFKLLFYFGFVHVLCSALLLTAPCCRTFC